MRIGVRRKRDGTADDFAGRSEPVRNENRTVSFLLDEAGRPSLTIQRRKDRFVGGKSWCRRGTRLARIGQIPAFVEIPFTIPFTNAATGQGFLAFLPKSPRGAQPCSTGTTLIGTICPGEDLPSSMSACFRASSIPEWRFHKIRNFRDTSNIKAPGARRPSRATRHRSATTSAPTRCPSRLLDDARPQIN